MTYPRRDVLAAQLDRAARLVRLSRDVLRASHATTSATREAIAESRECLATSAGRTTQRAVVMTSDPAELAEMLRIAAHLQAQANAKFVAFGRAIEAAVQAVGRN